MRSILWIGRGQGEGFGGPMLGDAAKCEVAWTRDAVDALELPLLCFDAIVLDELRLATIETSLAQLKATSTPIFVRVQPEQMHAAAQLLYAGAFDVSERSNEVDHFAQHLEKRLHHCVERPSVPVAKDSTKAPRPSSKIVGASPAMQHIFRLLEQAQRSDATVLITGETGTGKESLARAIHDHGKRNTKECIAVNCAAFPETLLESELFGHLRGAFTGADFEKKGLFEQADGGTLFLDEIADTSIAFQAKLLRALQEGEVRPVGSAKARRVDVRIIAATNRNLQQEVQSGNFREDLFYRIAVLPIAMPPLRDRTQDIAPLAKHFLQIYGRREGKPGCTLAPATLRCLEKHSWPGNVRELENELHRILTLVEAKTEIIPSLLAERITNPVQRSSVHRSDASELEIANDETLQQALDRIETILIRRTLHAKHNRRSETARRLGLTREGLYKKMRRLQIETYSLHRRKNEP